MKHKLTNTEINNIEVLSLEQEKLKHEKYKIEQKIFENNKKITAFEHKHNICGKNYSIDFIAKEIRDIT